MHDRSLFAALLEKYIADTISPEERTEFFTLLSSGQYDEWMSREIDQTLRSAETEGANLPPHRSAEILHKIIAAEKQSHLLIPNKSRTRTIIRWAAAAAVIGVLLFSTFLLLKPAGKNTVSATAVAKDLVTQTNTTGAPLKIAMEDGSVVTLQPGSAIHYPAHFSAAKREVFLDGEAFFDVSKNPNRPFYVFNRNIVTHVLGTSFNVKLNKATGQVEVAVRSGRVEVYENTGTEKTTALKNNGVILLPNQKVVYNEAARQFVPALVDQPLPLAPETGEGPAAYNMMFEETPLKTVLPSLEKIYGIEIVVENENLYRCLFTGDINQQDLYTRLEVVCQATGASYEIKGTRILVKGKGCD